MTTTITVTVIHWIGAGGVCGEQRLDEQGQARQDKNDAVIGHDRQQGKVEMISGKDPLVVERDGGGGGPPGQQKEEEALIVPHRLLRSRSLLGASRCPLVEWKQTAVAFPVTTNESLTATQLQLLHSTSEL